MVLAPPPPPGPPRGGGGGGGGLAGCVPTSRQPSVYVVNVLVSVVCDIVVDRLCDIVTGWDVVHGVVLGPVVRAIKLLGRDGGEAGDFVLRVNH